MTFADRKFADCKEVQNTSPVASCNIDPLGLYRFNTFAHLVGVGRAHFWRLQNRGMAPRPVVQHRKMTLYRGSDILAFLRDPGSFIESKAA